VTADRRPSVEVEGRRGQANAEAVRRLTSSEPVLIDVRPAGEVLAGMRPNLVLTSGPPTPWAAYTGGQRHALLGGACYEGLASDPEDAARRFDAGELEVGACSDHGCVGSLAGIYTWSMPVFVVENAPLGVTAACNFYEGDSHRRLNYGCWDEGVRAQLVRVNSEIAPLVGDAVRRAGGIPLKPIMQRALHMGDELHSRNTAATLLFARALFDPLLDAAAADARRVLATITSSDYFFLRLSMAAAKATADTTRDLEASSVVSAMTFNCRGFAIRVGGLGDRWFEGPHASVAAQLFEGHTADEITWMGGESTMVETVGLGGLAQAAALPLQRYQGGSAAAMIERNLEMYAITVAEHPDFTIPALDYRGAPTGIDVMRVVETGVTPAMDIGVAGVAGGQIGAGVVRAPLECFTTAAQAYEEAYG